MSKLPQLNLRVPEDYHQIMRDIAQRFRESSAPSFALDLAAWMRGQPEPPSISSLDEMAARVADLEAKVEALTAPAPTPTKRLTKGMVKSSLRKI